MGFASGSVSYGRFAVVGQAVPQQADGALLKKLAAHVLQETELGVPEEVMYGWSGGRHLFDNAFSLERNVFADAISFGLRVDTHRIPGSLLRAYTAIEEAALAGDNPSGFASKAQKKQAKEAALRKLADELRSGRHRRSKLLPLLWDLKTSTLHAAASGKSYELLAELFERTFNLTLVPLTAGAAALRHLEASGKRRAYEDFRPTRFVMGPGGEAEQPDYPWVARNAESKDFLGNEFLLWLWHQAEQHEGSLTVRSADGSGRKVEIAVLFDRRLDLDCAYGQSGRDSLRGDGPTRMPEARDALRSGKLPRRCGLLLHADGNEFSLNFAGESLAVGSAKLPDVPEAQSPRVLFEERVALLRELDATIDALFFVFLKMRASSEWESQVRRIRRWIAGSEGAVAAA